MYNPDIADFLWSITCNKNLYAFDKIPRDIDHKYWLDYIENIAKDNLLQDKLSKIYQLDKPKILLSTYLIANTLQVQKNVLRNYIRLVAKVNIDLLEKVSFKERNWPKELKDTGYDLISKFKKIN